MKRRKVSKRGSKKLFKATALKTNPKNLQVTRGGVRL